MSSGKYGAISGAVARLQMLNNISEHLAATKTPGYKKGMVTFEAKLGEANSGMATQAINHSRLSEQEIDFTHGHLEFSGHPLDLAINGDGFFQIERPDGSFGFTRKGHFQLDGEGTLVNTEGFPVMSSSGKEIILSTSDVDIGPDGSIWSDHQEIAKVGLFSFPDTSVLQRVGGEMFQPADEIQPELQSHPQIVQKNLEASNVDMMVTMMRMTENLRAFESIQKALKIYNDMDSKAAELGLVQ